MFMILTLLMSGFNTFAQTDNRHKSRLDIKPKSKTSSLTKRKLTEREYLKGALYWGGDKHT